MMGGGPGSSSMLLMMPEVQKELNITDDEKTKLQSLATDTGKAMQDGLGQVDFQSFRDMTQEERQKAFDDLRKKGEEAMKKFDVDGKVAGILDANQVKRLKELQLQREGAAALLRPEVAKKLGLSQEQQDSIKKIQDAARPTGRPTFDPNESQEDRQARIKKIRDQMDKAQKDSLAVLNDDQSLDWTNMLGKPFKFPAFQGFGRGNRPQPPQNNSQP